MTKRLITHLRHVDLAVPDHGKQLDFFTNTWGLKAEHTDTGLTFVTKQNVGPYKSADSKFEGGSKTDVINMPASIPLPPASTLSR